MEIVIVILVGGVVLARSLRRSLPRRPDRCHAPRQPDRPSPPPRLVSRPAAPVPPVQPRGAGGVIRGKCWVVDGDTIVIGRHTIRLFGIDAPEMDHPYGRKSKWAMVQLCKGQTVTATVTGEVSHDRPVAICTLDDGRDLSAELVKQGLALDWRKYSGGRYRHLEPPGIRKRLWITASRQRPGGSPHFAD